MRGRLGALLLAVALVGAAACSDDGASTASPTARTASASGSITVSAAASLTEAFDEIGSRFGRANPDAKVAFNFGSSGTLATQIRQGVPADAFASADTATMDTLVAADVVVGEPAVFARNRLVIVTKPGNPEQVRTLIDLARLDVVSLCGSEVPCGKYAEEILGRARVRIPEDHVTRGQDVKATLGAVTTGDADAAIVYATDARVVRDSVTTVAIPDAQDAIATYPIAVLKASGNRGTARAFVDFVLSRAGQSVLRAHGFLPPA